MSGGRKCGEEGGSREENGDKLFLCVEKTMEVTCG